MAEERERLMRELAEADAELRAHMASWEYAFAMGSGRDGGRQHPMHWETRARTDRLVARCDRLRARLSEYDG
jgi:diadenosine tetraphosphate (Ap4A) HIT family hydrolase